MKKAVLLFCVLFVAAGCQTVEVPRRSKMFQTQAFGVQPLAQDPQKGVYFLTVNVIDPPPRPYYLKVQFEDPCNWRNRVIIDRAVHPEKKKISITSPPVGCFKANKKYKVKIMAYRSQYAELPMDVLKQKVESIITLKKMKNFATKSTFGR